MRIIVLTSSRADYGIYRPLLRQLKQDSAFELNIVAFGTHLSEKFGYTVNQIRADGFEVYAEIETLPEGDSPQHIAESTGKTISAFSAFWEKEKSRAGWIMCLGDRYEMFAAVCATVPFALPVAHLHGGETTLGAIDNVYRHSITHMSRLHFTSTLDHSKRVIELTGENKNVHYVGALSLDNLNDITLLSAEEFAQRFNIPINKPVLVTFHPETVSFEKNTHYVGELVRALAEIDGQIIITMPNADTSSSSIRQALVEFAARRSNVYTVESLGTQGYFSCLSLCRFVLGNSSSGIIEAASFGKYVINIGARQLGRESGKNVLHCAIAASEIGAAVAKISTLPALSNENIYGNGRAAGKIMQVLREEAAHLMNIAHEG